MVQRLPCPSDGRATNARLTDAGWDKIVASAPGHVATVRENVIDVLTPKQIDQLAEITDVILSLLDPDGAVAALEAVERVTVLAEVVDDLGPVARRTLRAKLRRRDGGHGG